MTILNAGMPFCPESKPKHPSAFMRARDGDEMTSYVQGIDTDTKILVTHTPPFNHLDISMISHTHIGDVLLGKKIQDCKIGVHVFGHVHVGYGVERDADTVFINPSMCDHAYKVCFSVLCSCR